MMDLKAEDLVQFIGTTQWWRHPIARQVTYTEGVKYVADHGGAYWLIDHIAFAQLFEPFTEEPMQCWTLIKDSEGTGATLNCTDGNYNPIWEGRIPFTDFPLPKIEIWVEGDVLLLPSEH